MNLFVVALLLAAGHALLGGMALASPASFGGSLRRFARNVPAGVVLMLAGTAWFLYNLWSSDLTDFAALRPFLYAAVALVGVGNCLFVQDYIAVRGVSVVALLACDRILDLQRWHKSAGFDPNGWLQPKNLVVLWCYVVVVVAIWFVHSPFRLRDALDWVVATPSRLRQVGGASVGFAVLLAAIAVTWLR